MKKWFLILVIFYLTAPYIVRSQNSDYQILTTYQSSGIFSSNDIFDFSINNFSGHTTDCKLEIKMVESKTHLPIIQLLNNSLELEKGINLFNSSNFSVNYFPNDLSSAFRIGQPLQSGRFEICITLTILQIVEKQIKECAELNFSEDFFIHLLVPDDKEEIESLNPLLQWYSSSNDPSIKYRLVLAPLAPFRQPEEAIGHNLKFLQLEIADMQFLYPLTAPDLEFGKYYAWQVYALKDNVVLGMSEAWTFIPIKRKETSNEKSDCYRIIVRNLNNGNYLYGDVMKFAYQNATLEEKLNYSIQDLTSGTVITNPPVLVLKPGLNKIDLELKKLKGIKEGHDYLVQIRNRNNEIYKLTFKPYSENKMGD